jgi:hypothetical protein
VRIRDALLILVIAVPCGAQDDLERALVLRTSDPCLREPPLMPDVARWLHGAPIDPALRVVIRSTDDASGSFVLEVVWGSEVVGERVFEGRDATCEERRGALGLLIALAIETAQSDRREPTPARAPSLSVAMALEGNAALAVLPVAGGGSAIALELALPELVAFRAVMMGAFAPDATLGVGSVSTSLVAGRADGCLEPSAPPFRFETCLGLGVGAVGVWGHGYTRDQSSWMPWVAAIARAGARWEIDPTWALRLAADALIPLARPEIVILDAMDNVVARAPVPPAGAAISLGLRAVFP